jgi:GntR family transcriptional regulator, transcriptional repressor for pyruvate dehydrogenase complex
MTIENTLKLIEPIAKDLMHQKVSDALISYIYRNGLRPGDKLPSERRLAAELAVGRNSVRMGLCQLEEDGVIERMAGKGAFVKREVSAESIQLKLMRVNYKDLLEIKICLEQLAIRRAVESASNELIAKLRKIAERLKSLADQKIFSTEIDREFHTTLLECAGSPTLSQLVLSLIDSLNSFTNMLGNVSEIWIRTIPFHVDIVEALENRQLDYALAAHQYIYQYDTKVLEDLTDKETTH